MSKEVPTGGAFFLDANQGWLTADAHIKFTTDGGVTWTDAAIPDAVSTEDIRVQLRGMFIVQDPLPPFEITGWAVGDNGVVLQAATGSNGQTWLDRNLGSRVLDACLLPATLYDIFMFPPTYLNGWCVGEDGAIATTGDGGATWTNVSEDVDDGGFFCDPIDPGDPQDAYVVHFFSDHFAKGIIAAEYRNVYTTSTQPLMVA